MSADLVIALIALARSISSAVATVVWSPWGQARRERARTLDIYREPLPVVAYELQARAHNILVNNFVGDYLDGGPQGDSEEAAVLSTLYVFAQYFGWREIVPREVQLLRFVPDEETRRIPGILAELTETFLTNTLDPKLMSWRVEERGLGKKMVEYSGGRPSCLGDASFIAERAKIERWLGPLEPDLRSIGNGGHERRFELQRKLLALVHQLDKDGIDYPATLRAA